MNNAGLNTRRERYASRYGRVGAGTPNENQAYVERIVDKNGIPNGPAGISHPLMATTTERLAPSVLAPNAVFDKLVDFCKRAFFVNSRGIARSSRRRITVDGFRTIRALFTTTTALVKKGRGIR